MEINMGAFTIIAEAHRILEEVNPDTPGAVLRRYQAGQYIATFTRNAEAQGIRERMMAAVPREVRERVEFPNPAILFDHLMDPDSYTLIDAEPELRDADFTIEEIVKRWNESWEPLGIRVFIRQGRFRNSDTREIRVLAELANHDDTLGALLAQ